LGKHDCSNTASFPLISSSNLIFGIILYQAVPKYQKYNKSFYLYINIKNKVIYQHVGHKNKNKKKNYLKIYLLFFCCVINNAAELLANY